jgi:hypothetical protein
METLCHQAHACQTIAEAWPAVSVIIQLLFCCGTLSIIRLWQGWFCDKFMRRRTFPRSLLAQATEVID